MLGAYRGRGQRGTAPTVLERTVRRDCEYATSQVFESYQKLAEHYEDESDYKTCIYFWEKCLEISKVRNNRRQHANAALLQPTCHAMQPSPPGNAREHVRWLLRRVRSAS